MLAPDPAAGDVSAAAVGANLAFYEPLWKSVRLADPARFNTWTLIQSLARPGVARLEVAPGLRPRLPLTGTRFLDASASAIAKLRAGGASAEVGLVSHLPYDDAAFGLVAAFDVVEHVADDNAALSELVRVLAPGGSLLLAIPLHAALWTKFDDLVGHQRRYEPEQLAAMLERHGLTVVQSAVYGMQPRSSIVIAFGVLWMTRLRRAAYWWYDRLLFFFGVWFQKRLRLSEGMIDLTGVDEVLLVCRKA